MRELKEHGVIPVTFVDSPGFGDDQETFSNLQSEAMSCDAYIFVINNGSHHGVEKDRLGKMMKKVQERARVSNIILNPSSAFFICNKADLVPAENTESVRRDVLRRLQAIWPSISEQQIFSFSASQYFLYSFSWLISFLESASALANNCNIHRGFVKQKREEASVEILSHERNLNQLYKDIKSCLSVKGANLSTWSLENIPPQRDSDNWSRYKKRLTDLIIDRIEATVLDDTDASKLLDEYSEVLKAIIEKFHTTKLERSLVRQETLDAIARWSILDDLIIPILDRFFKFYTYFVWGVDPFSLKYVAALKYRECAGHDEDNSREDDFELDRLKFMQALSSTHVKRIMTEPHLTHFALHISATVESEARVLMENIDQGRKTLKEYSRAVTSGMKIACNNDPFRTIASECHYFYTMNVMQHEIEFSRLRLDTINKNDVIGEGGFGRVLKGELQKGSQNIPVAAKIIRCFRRYIDDEAVPDDMTIFRECCLMRQLMLKMNVAEDGGCPNFVHYYGSTSTETDDTYELILVMELCDTDLHKQVKSGSLIPYNDIPFPGKVSAERNTSVLYAIDIALQAARGLHFVHKNGIVHRDVKPSNFLMKVRDGRIIVKISDVGLSKEHNKITTFASDIGTLVYQAPENLDIPLSIHSVFSDVYSFGLLLWEMWYGEHVFSEVPDNQLRRHLIKKHPAFKNIKPPKPLINLMNMCWRKKPITRPDMEKVVDELARLKQN
ncbi:hypothetical protein ACJMK2_041358 [Sinanodonta woodiana]|uniref:Protein kinase domain-containing protein n=1 Tax=Sinanodonta woodiana TaxID=1069815 RepID=A0ABD3W3V8_SINWO